jgi:uncharacterized protein
MPYPLIDTTAAGLTRDSGGSVQPVRVDLATYDGTETRYRTIAVTGRPVDAIALNAGRSIGGDVARDTDLREELNVIDVNVTSTVHLAKRVLPDMVARGEGLRGAHEG